MSYPGATAYPGVASLPGVAPLSEPSLPGAPLPGSTYPGLLAFPGVATFPSSTWPVVNRDINITVSAPTGHPFAVSQPRGNALTIGSPEAS